MQTFVQKHDTKVVGSLSCFDRVIFKGHSGLGYPAAMEGFLDRQGVLYKDFKEYAPGVAAQLKANALAVAERAGRPYEYLSGHVRKEELAREIAQRDGLTTGLICVFGTLECCRSFRVVPGAGKPRLRREERKCQHFYFYYLDREFGFMHVRVQSWFPFEIQVYVNGHEWLARKLDSAGIAYRRVENAFTWIADPERAQRFADRFVERRWERILAAFACRVNPLLGKSLRADAYYWVTDQAEYATDVMFKDRQTLAPLYAKLLRHSTLCFSAEDVLTFLGKKRLSANFQGEVLNDYKQRQPGARVKHRAKENWIKMYDKLGCVLRVETVINRPYLFQVRRHGKRNGRWLVDWFPLLKGVGYLYGYAQVARRANERYLEALSVVEDPSESYRLLDRIVKPARFHGRKVRGLNPLREDDLKVFQAVQRGEHHLQGFRNADLRQRLYPHAPADPTARRRLSARVSRILQRLRAHGLIRAFAGCRRYRVTSLGLAIMSAAIHLHEHGILPLLHPA